MKTYFRLDNDNVKDVMEDFLPFCVSLATYADPTKRNEPYNEKEEVCGEEALPVPALSLETQKMTDGLTD